MIPTLLGVVIVLAGFVLLWRSRLEAMLSFAMICTLMSGSAAIILTALGSSSIAPASVGMVFLLARIALDRTIDGHAVRSAVRANAAYLTYAIWAVAGAVFLPRIFAGQINVAPLRPTGLRNLFDTFPLQFSNQNITASVYIVGSCLLAIGSFIAVQRPRGAVVFARTAALVAGIHAATGFCDLLLPESVWSIVKGFFRNGTYAQLDQSIAGFKRVSGIQPEASGFAGYGFCWLVLVFELWLRDIYPRRTGPVSAALLFILVLSTSATAYVSMVAYAAILVMRTIAFPGSIPFRKIVWIAGCAMAACVAICLIILGKPALGDELWSVIDRVIFEKGDSASGLQRAFWAKQGFEAFRVSHGLGIGPGSFRSSNVFTAVLGSLGVIGVIAWLTYIATVFKPLRRTTYRGSDDKVLSIGLAASWAALCVLIPGMLAAPSPDPGFNFSLFAGTALGLRHGRLHLSGPHHLRRNAVASARAPSGVH